MSGGVPLWMALLAMVVIGASAWLNGWNKGRKSGLTAQEISLLLDALEAFERWRYPKQEVRYTMLREKLTRLEWLP